MIMGGLFVDNAHMHILTQKSHPKSFKKAGYNYLKKAGYNYAKKPPIIM